MPEKPLFGYKMDVAVDQGSGLVRRAILTPGHVPDKAPFLALVQGDEPAVYADPGYDGWWYRAELPARGIADGIMAGDYWRRPLGAKGHARNRALAALRAPIERTFGVLKRWYRYGRVRYSSLAHNALQLQLLAVAQPAPRARADLLRGERRPDHGRAAVMVPKAASNTRHHAVPRTFDPFLRSQGTNSGITSTSD